MKKKIVVPSIIIFAGLIVCILLVAKTCISHNASEHVAEKKLCATILPVRYIVERITGGDFNIDVLVPPGASPETYEPPPLQMRNLEESQLIFTIGLIDFERELMKRFARNDKAKIVNLSEGVRLIEGQCFHGYSHDSHNHGVDPHIWSSPKALKQMADNAYEAIALLYPDSIEYKVNHERLVASIDSLDFKIRNILSDSEVNYFIICHPALTYYSENYDLRQVPLEQEGKEPSAARIREIVDMARRDGITRIFYQKEFSRAVVETVAYDIGAQIIEIDPLAEDVLSNILLITKSIGE